MRAPSIGLLSFGAVGFAALMLMLIGPPNHVTPPAFPHTFTPPPGPSAAEGGGITLTSTTIDLPDDDGTYPDGPHADVINANCTACHSASMALTQPPLSADQWKGEVTKMREIYMAPVPATAVPDIVAYLAAMSAKLPPGGRGAKIGGQKVAHDVSGSTG